MMECVNIKAFEQSPKLDYIPPKKITSQEAQAPKDLVQYENTLVLQDDKGKAMDSADYSAKVGQVLNEEGT